MPMPMPSDKENNIKVMSLHMGANGSAVLPHSTLRFLLPVGSGWDCSRMAGELNGFGNGKGLPSRSTDSVLGGT